MIFTFRTSPPGAFRRCWEASSVPRAGLPEEMCTTAKSKARKRENRMRRLWQATGLMAISPFPARKMYRSRKCLSLTRTLSMSILRPPRPFPSTFSKKKSMVLLFGSSLAYFGRSMLKRGSSSQSPKVIPRSILESRFNRDLYMVPMSSRRTTVSCRIAVRPTMATSGSRSWSSMSFFKRFLSL